MVLRLALLAALSGLMVTSTWTPDPIAPALDPDDIALLVAAALGTDTIRLRRR
jgi:hypothetical protein